MMLPCGYITPDQLNQFKDFLTQFMRLVSYDITKLIISKYMEKNKVISKHCSQVLVMHSLLIV